MPNHEEITAVRMKLRDMSMQDWLHHSLFTYKWWLILLITLIAWYCLFRYMKRERLTETLLYGSFVTLVALMMDLLGVNLILWDYPIRLGPLSQPLLAFDLVLLPVSYIFIYQNTTNWKSFTQLTLMLSFVFAFIIEPILVWLHMYELYRWYYFYSFIIYSLIAILIRWVVKKIVRINLANPL